MSLRIKCPYEQNALGQGRCTAASLQPGCPACLAYVYDLFLFTCQVLDFSTSKAICLSCIRTYTMLRNLPIPLGPHTSPKESLFIKISVRSFQFAICDGGGIDVFNTLSLGVCRDFDDLAEYHRWAKVREDLAERLPTSITSGGRHVYFRGNFVGIQYIAGGELRGKGGYAILPPSKHPEGRVYTWAIAPTADNLIQITAEQAGFLPSDNDVTDACASNVLASAREREELKQIDCVQNKNAIEQAIAASIPEEPGTRNRKIFELARSLKTIFPNAEPGQLRGIVQSWHEQALPNIRARDFLESWGDFVIAWPRVRFPKGEGTMDDVFNRGLKAEPSAIAVELYPDNPKMQQLVAICATVQEACGEQSWFLSCRKAAELLDVSSMQAARWLAILCADGILELVSKGGTARSARKASRYRYRN